MKKFFGLCILVILLVVASGCTQPTTTAATPVPTAVITTEIPTPEVTMPPTEVATTIAPTPEPTTAAAVTTEVTAETTTVTTPKPVMTPSTKVTTIYIRNNTFVPSELTVLPGTGITWINDDRTVHTIRTVPQSPIKFIAGDIVPGASFGYTFGENEGTFGFIDTYTNATGMIIVKKGESFVGAPALQTPTPTAAVK
jgi:plastocyanin